MIKITGNEYLKGVRSLFSWSNALIAQGHHKIYSPERNHCKHKPSKQTKSPIWFLFLLKIKVSFEKLKFSSDAFFSFAYDDNIS